MLVLIASEKLRASCFCYVIGSDSKKLYASSSQGIDKDHCGSKSLPCFSIFYTVMHRATNGDVISLLIDAPYVVNKTMVIGKDLTIIGGNGKGISKPLITWKSRSNIKRMNRLFLVTNTSQQYRIKVTMINLWFDGLDVLQINKGSTFTIINCDIFNGPGKSIVISAIESDQTTEMRLEGVAFKNCRHALFANNLLYANIVVLNSLFTGLYKPKDSMTYFNQYGITVTKKLSDKRKAFSTMAIANTSFVNLNHAIKFDCSTWTNVNYTRSLCQLNITNTLFRKNGRPNSVEVLSPSITVNNVFIHISHNSFLENLGPFGCGLLANKSIVNITGCRFKDNCATESGGAAFFSASYVTINKSVFLNNRANNANDTSILQIASDYQKGAGGAIFDHKSSLTVADCSFNNNTASFYGGAIFHTNALESSALRIRDTTICVGEVVNEVFIYARGQALYSFSEVFLTNVSIKTPEIPGSELSLIFYQSFDGSSNSLDMSQVKVKCPFGWKAQVKSQLSVQKLGYSSLIVGCIPCPKYTYSLNFSYGHFYHTPITNSTKAMSAYKVFPIRCDACPFGAICVDGRVKPKNNFWGYKYKMYDNVIFKACPPGYCCQGPMCFTYDSCRTGRIGSLCGSCIDGYTENIFSPNCIKFDAKCQKPWLWFMFGATGIVVVTFFMYLKEIGYLVKKCINVRHIYHKVIQRMESTSSVSGLNNSLQSSEDDLVHPLVTINSANLTEKNEIPYSQDNSFFSGLIKILFFFYQAEVLFEVYATNFDQIGIASLLKELLASIFNWRIDGMFNNQLEWCPVESLKPVTKALLTFSFILYLFVIISVMAIASAIIKTAFPKSGNTADRIKKVSFKTRLSCCGLQIFLIGYNNITKTLFSLLNCIELETGNKVLFLDGNIKCYQSWQYMSFIVVSLWIIPFPVALYLASNLLRNGDISVRTFFVGLTFPFPFTVYWVYGMIAGKCCSAVYDRNLHDVNTSETEEILAVLQGPFRLSSRKGQSSKGHPILWESTLIGRRLLLIALYTFILNNFIRLFIMLMVTIVFIIHNSIKQPYRRKLLNLIESGFLICLCILCFINIVPAYNYMYPASPSVSDAFRSVQKVFDTTEAILLLAAPIAILGFVIVACVIRIFYCIWTAVRFILIRMRRNHDL